MNHRQRKTLQRVFTEPTSSTIKWASIVALISACGARISEGSGSRVRMYLNGMVAVFHRPHPHPAAEKGTVDSVRLFLMKAGVTPELAAEL
jgi:hypothetical protein